MKRHIEWARSAEKELLKLDKPIQRQIKDDIEKFADTGEGDVEAISGEKKGMPPLYRLRSGDWRVYFDHSQGQLVVYVLRIVPRGQAYSKGTMPKRKR